MKEYLPVSAKKIAENLLDDYAPLTLCTVGDSVHTLFLRTFFSEKDRYKNAELHKEVSEYACAASQAADAKTLLPLLTEAERKIFNKAKNTKAKNIPKNASHYEYQMATAFEGVCGFLYLSGQNDRLAELFEAIYGDRFRKIQEE